MREWPPHSKGSSDALEVTGFWRNDVTGQHERSGSDGAAGGCGNGGSCCSPTTAARRAGVASGRRSVPLHGAGAVTGRSGTMADRRLQGGALAAVVVGCGVEGCPQGGGHKP